MGSLGQPLEPLVRFALYLAGYSLQPLDTRGTAAFNDGLRTLLRQTGLEGKPTAVIVDVRCSLILPFCRVRGKPRNKANILTNTVEKFSRCMAHDVVVLPASYSKSLCEELLSQKHFSG